MIMLLNCDSAQLLIEVSRPQGAVIFRNSDHLIRQKQKYIDLEIRLMNRLLKCYGCHSYSTMKMLNDEAHSKIPNFTHKKKHSIILFEMQIWKYAKFLNQKYLNINNFI